jgi:hypothetical protein
LDAVGLVPDERPKSRVASSSGAGRESEDREKPLRDRRGDCWWRDLKRETTAWVVESKVERGQRG